MTEAADLRGSFPEAEFKALTKPEPAKGQGTLARREARLAWEWPARSAAGRRNT